MKKLWYIIPAALVMVAVACNNEPAGDETNEDETTNEVVSEPAHDETHDEASHVDKDEPTMKVEEEAKPAEGTEEEPANKAEANPEKQRAGASKGDTASVSEKQRNSGSGTGKTDVESQKQRN